METIELERLQPYLRDFLEPSFARNTDRSIESPLEVHVQRFLYDMMSLFLPLVLLFCWKPPEYDLSIRLLGPVLEIMGSI